MSAKVIISGLLFILVLVSGLWLSKLGRPFNQVLFTIHKLITLAAIVFGIMALLNFNKQTSLTTLQLTVAIVIGAVLVVSMVTGGILSVKEEINQVIKTAHKASSAISIIGLIYLFYSLLKH